MAVVSILVSVQLYVAQSALETATNYVRAQPVRQSDCQLTPVQFKLADMLTQTITARQFSI